ncbi:30S ribosomal protein S4 [Symbiobacterium thermophilum]|jgi:small subunit ribosomal protein S4|uniref:Small ribosomal subunit protein uS4 n=1 Tax=Symbiobacterium thermophilum TaxID=2734 RepID=A0A1Y2T8N7_SYMTR|nr:30S ribosomal protein S4 [Symbiobacterium thermophilum]MBY6274781.1 30S ribosomal protein S4 [Symbiobacterium thermophilum]OTA42094.1 MAG: 30S ribosomal protein S4 [Symbiobacterium thermophilum]
MARYTGPVCRLCRREGVKLYLKGEKCYSDKCPVVKRATPPGQHGASRRKPTEYAIQLREKQKARRYYGVLERQFERYFEMASRKKGVTGEVLLQTLERRLDNVVYRMGFAASRAEARQIVKHSHIEVNGRKVNIPSYLVREGDVVAVRESSREHKRIKELAAAATRTVPAWLSVDPEALRGTVLRLPNRDEIDTPVQEQLIVEFYSR